MLTKSKIALSVALVLGTATAATAAPKHPVHRPQAAVERQAPAGAYQSFGSAGRTWSEPLYMHIQSDDFRRSIGG